MVSKALYLDGLCQKISITIKGTSYQTDVPMSLHSFKMFGVICMFGSISISLTLKLSNVSLD